MTHSKSNGQPKTVRCAIYTRKSTEEGLEQEFNSLDAQRESGEAYIKSQAQEGWICLPDHYDDGGFTGGNMDRPALKRLMTDIEEGRVDCLVVYKVDRLSRSLMDFARMMETFETHGISFVSVTQQFNTTHSMGRLTLNILLSFAQFEREIISERTRDKIAAARRKGKWVGGRPILGYDVVAGKLVVNPTEALQVRQIFALYLEMQSIMATIAELDRRGWRTKRWTSRKGIDLGGRPFDKATLYGLLTNPAYLGKVRHKDELYAGEHKPIVDEALFDQVQALRRQNHRTGGVEARNRFKGLLRGLLRCVPCNANMVSTHATKGTKRYRYYVCLCAQKRGYKNCPSKSIPAAEIERFVIEQIRMIGRDPALVTETLAQIRRKAELRIAELNQEQEGIEGDLSRFHAAMRDLVLTPGLGSERMATRLADMQERIRLCEHRLTAIGGEVASLDKHIINDQDAKQTLSEFDAVWEQLSLREQARVLERLIARIDYDGRTGEIAITFHPTGIATLGVVPASGEEDAA